MESIVTLHPSGREIPVRPGETVLDAAIRAGLNLPHSCKGGSCLVCRAQVLAGEIHHPDLAPGLLSEADLAAGQALLCLAQVRGTSAHIQVPEILPADAPGIRRLPVRVARMDAWTADVMAVFLRPPPVDPLPFLAGQYIDVLMEQGRRRGFSLACPPHDAALLELHVRKVPGGSFSGQVFESLRTGDLLEIEGPLGSFFLREDSSRPVLMMAGGTGFAPLKAILRHALYRSIGRPIHLYWGVRTAADLYASSWLTRLAQEQPGFAWTPVLSAAGRDSGWTGREGLVHETLLADHPDLSGFDVYASGPPAMVDAALARFPHHGLPVQHLFVDSFEFAPDTLAAMRKKSPRPDACS